MLTELGKMLRKIRLNNNELLKDMSDKLNVTASYLSAVEHGKRELPSEWITDIISLYELNHEDAYALQDAADMSSLSIKINLKGQSKEMSSLANAFARKFNDFDQNDVNELMNIINKERR